MASSGWPALMQVKGFIIIIIYINLEVEDYNCTSLMIFRFWNIFTILTELKAGQPLPSSQFLKKSVWLWSVIIYMSWNDLLYTININKMGGQNYSVDGIECRAVGQFSLLGTASNVHNLHLKFKMCFCLFDNNNYKIYHRKGQI